MFEYILWFFENLKHEKPGVLLVIILNHWLDGIEDALNDLDDGE